MKSLQTVAELNALPEHNSSVQEYAGNPCNPEVAVAHVRAIARSLDELLRGGHLEPDQTGEMFRWLVDQIERRAQP